MSKSIINIAKNFSKEPYGRYPEDGPSNGTKFRDKLLLPALKEFDVVTVIFDGAEGYGSSFLEEAFGGLVRINKYSAKELKSKLKLISNEDPSIVDEVWDYING